MMIRWCCAAVLMMVMQGCGVQRTLTVQSDPPGALLFLNGVEVGRTPVTRDFTWYGVYDVTLRMDGYETLKTEGHVKAPWWQVVPIDLLAELLPLRPHDLQHLSFTMKPLPDVVAEPEEMLRRAQEMEQRLEAPAPR